MMAFGFCKLSEHAYGRSPKLQRELKLALTVMMHRLETGKPRMISAKPLDQWLFTLMLLAIKRTKLVV